jgi:hypothetical protein
MKVWFLILFLAVAILVPSIEPLRERMRQQKIVLPEHADNIKMWQGMLR